MRRNRSGVLNFTFFLLALTLIIYLNLPARPSHKLFAWNKIQYTTSAKVLPQARGICPDLSNDLIKPVLIMARISKEPLSHLTDSLSSFYHICPYTADAEPNPKSTNLQVPANRGHEAMAYLTFIIDSYDSLPASGMVFVHGNRFAWHNDYPTYDIVALLQQLKVTRALWGPPGPATGYANLRCDWSAGMCDASNSEARPQGSFETATRALLEPGNVKAISDTAFAASMEDIFGRIPIVADPIKAKTSKNSGDREQKLHTALDRADALRSQCCAQFVVARENIWRHSQAEYAALRQWLLDGNDESADKIRSGVTHWDQARLQDGNSNADFGVRNRPAPADNLVAGRILSYIWHILFLPSSLEMAQRTKLTA